MKKVAILLALIGCSFTAPKKKVLFVGDSLTCYAGGWQAQVSRSLGYQFDNISKGGKRTDWMLRTLTNQLKVNSDYDFVFIYGGCNDAYSHVSLDKAVQNVQDMIDICIKLGIKPIVIIGYDPELVQTTTSYPPKTTEFHRNRYVELQKKMSSRLRYCTIVEKDTTVTRKDSDDGIHLKASGHSKFANWVIKKLS